MSDEERETSDEGDIPLITCYSLPHYSLLYIKEDIEST